jgi:hypothetical protein
MSITQPGDFLLIAPMGVPNDASPVARAAAILGGYAAVVDTTERDGIPVSSRKQGMLVRANDGTFYVLGAGLTNSDWSVSSGLGGGAIPAPALVATSNIVLTGIVTVDGVASNTVTGDVLCTAQTTASQNGYWTPNAGAWTRPSYYNSDVMVAAALGQTGQAVLGGTLGAGSVWFQSVGVTLAGAKTWNKLATPSLLQDALGTTLPAQSLTQHKGATILQDPSNGRNTVDHDRVDIREYNGNPNGYFSTTATGSGAALTLAARSLFVVGNWALVLGGGADHGMTTPAAPTVAAQGVTGSRTVSVKIVALTGSYGYTAASSATTITNANAAIGINNTASNRFDTCVEVWAAAVPGAYKYLVYVQLDGSGAYNYAGGFNANPEVFETTSYLRFPMSFKLVTATAATPPPGLPATAPASAAKNGIRTQITALNGLAATVSPALVNAVTAAQFEICNKLPFENAELALGVNSGQLLLATGVYYVTGDLHMRNRSHLVGSNRAAAGASSQLLFRDGCGFTVSSYIQGQIRQPGTLYRVGDVVLESVRSAASVSFKATAISGGAAWGATGTGGDPAWDTVSGHTTTDGAITWTAGIAGPASANYHLEGVSFQSNGSTIPANRHYTVNDLRLRYNVLLAGVWTANAAYPAGTWVVPSAAKITGKVYRWSGGTTGATEPATWGRANGGTTADNGNTWTCADQDFVDGAGIVITQQGTSEHCQAKGFRGSGVYFDGNSTNTGGNCDSSKGSHWETSLNFGHDFVFVGADANLCKLSNCQSEGGFPGAGGCLVQDNSFYGVALEHMDCAGYKRYQNQKSNSVQSSSVLRECYMEGGGTAPSDTDWNAPGYIVGGNLGGLLRAGSNAKRYNFGLSTPYDSPGYVRDVDAHITVAIWAASTVYAAGALVCPTVPNGMAYQASAGTSGGTEPKWTTVPGKTNTDNTVTWQCYAQPTAAYTSTNGVKSDTWGGYIDGGTVATGTVLEEQRSQASPGIQTMGRVATRVLSGSVDLEYAQHFGIRGATRLFSNGILTGASFGGVGLESVLKAVSAIPSAGLFQPGDYMPWVGNDARRLAIVAAQQGVIGGSGAFSAWTGSHVYARGALVTANGQYWMMVLPSGTSAASGGPVGVTQPGEFATDGSCLWQLVLGVDPGLRAVPNWGAEPIALANADATIDISQGSVRKLAAATANRAITIALTNAMAGDGLRLENPNSVAFTWTFTGVDGGTLVLPASSKTWVELVVNQAATTWHQVRSGTLV